MTSDRFRRWPWRRSHSRSRAMDGVRSFCPRDLTSQISAPSVGRILEIRTDGRRCTPQLVIRFATHTRTGMQAEPQGSCSKALIQNMAECDRNRARCVKQQLATTQVICVTHTGFPSMLISDGCELRGGLIETCSIWVKVVARPIGSCSKGAPSPPPPGAGAPGRAGYVASRR